MFEKIRDDLREILGCIKKDVMFILGVDKCFDENNFKKGIAIANNLLDNRIPEDREKLAFIQTFQMNPFFLYYTRTTTIIDKCNKLFDEKNNIEYKELLTFFKIDFDSLNSIYETSREVWGNLNSLQYAANQKFNSQTETTPQKQQNTQNNQNTQNTQMEPEYPVLDFGKHW